MLHPTLDTGGRVRTLGICRCARELTESPPSFRVLLIKSFDFLPLTRKTLEYLRPLQVPRVVLKTVYISYWRRRGDGALDTARTG